MNKRTTELFTELISVCNRLRGKDGCLWDREQTHKSLITYLKEETNEVIEAIENADAGNLKEEPGDLLYEIIFHSQIAGEEKNFTIEDVIEGILQKIIRRHPHIFSNVKVSSVEEILKYWEEIKKKGFVLGDTGEDTVVKKL